MQYASTFLGFVMQMHVFHWLTTSYSQHKALGELYDGIHDLADNFMETYMGKYGRNMPTSAASVINYNTSNVNETISNFEAFLISLTGELDSTDTDLLNIRDEMLSLVHTTQYFLTLN
jgi:DNA-binding ferritin-like protein